MLIANSLAARLSEVIVKVVPDVADDVVQELIAIRDEVDEQEKLIDQTFEELGDIIELKQQKPEKFNA